MALRSFVIAASILIPSFAVAQPAPKRDICKADLFTTCTAHKAMNARAEIISISKNDDVGPNGDANSMYGFNSAAGNSNGRTGGGGAGGGGASGGGGD